MDFFIKKYTAAVKFTPHYNRTLGKYYDTSREYVSDLKARGLEPYRGEDVNKRKPMSYKPSKWCREITRTIERDGLTGCVKKELARAGIKDVPKEVIPHRTGGWF